ncbi:GNAT family N-acetyltransferase [Falsirhodobacter sp. alg1]|uniref:GNAT family N-acetyltransferase n=1 Tax=Falsirhodobacter sp. alg1 TaxID=1472418 RepID=UPI0005F08A46|nr:GNAT family N-acyltransferase [Falsirhodobacter sp. alg1]
MRTLTRGRYRVRLAAGAADLARARALRTLAFRLNVQDGDAFDDSCLHVLVEDADDLVACYRLLLLTPDEIEQSYSAQFYDLSALRRFHGPMIEMGRFCIHPARRDPNIVRVAWGGVAAAVDEAGAAMLFGCSSFYGTEPAPYEDAFALLRQAHLAPAEWQPTVKAPDVFRYAETDRDPNLQKAMRGMPPLLRSYLLMGGWVSDHAVVDSHMNTLHVFTGLEIAAIPPARAQLLRAIAN